MMLMILHSLWNSSLQKIKQNSTVLQNKWQATDNKMLSYRRETVLQSAFVLAKSVRLELGYNISRTL